MGTTSLSTLMSSSCRVLVVGPFRVALEFTDGAYGIADLGPWIAGRGGIFRALQDPTFLGQVVVDPEAGTIVWPNVAMAARMC